MPELDPAAEFEAWRCVWSVLSGSRVPVITPDAQPVLEALAEITATTLAARFREEDGPVLLALGYAEDRLSRLALADVVTAAEDPPG